MKFSKKVIAILAVIGVLATTGATLAATSKSPAEIVSGLTGKTVADLNQERTAGKTYGTIANEAGKLEEFKTQMLEQKKVILDQRVAEGRLTQEQADATYKAIQDNQVNCDGTGSVGLGRRNGAGFGGGCGMAGGQWGAGAGQRNGGWGMGFGR